MVEPWREHAGPAAAAWAAAWAARGQEGRAGESSKIWQSPRERDRRRKAAFAGTDFSSRRRRAKIFSRNEKTMLTRLQIPGLFYQYHE